MKQEIFSVPTRTVRTFEFDLDDVALLDDTTGIELIPAQGDDKFVRIERFYIVLNAGTTEFDGGGELRVRRGSNVIVAADVADTIAGTDDSIYEFNVDETDTQITDVNENINLYSSTAVTNGAGAKLKIRIEYDVVSISTPNPTVY